MFHHMVPDAIHNSRSSIIPKCYPGTRGAILQDLVQWVENVHRRRPIYYLYAPAGSGKTAIAKTLADYFSDPDCPSKKYLLASVFFSRTAEIQNNARRLISTIAFQVAVNIPLAAQYIADAITVDPLIFRKDFHGQVHSLILQPLRMALEGSLTPDQPRLLVIDGLDECQGQETLLKVISELALFRPFPLAIFLSCRPEVHIRKAFEIEPLKGLSLKVGLTDKYDSEGDIRIFLGSRFKEIRNAQSSSLKLLPDWPGEEVVNALIRKSSGHFIYPAVVIKYMDRLGGNPIRRLEVILGLAESGADEGPFAQMDGLYIHILSSIESERLPTVIGVLSFGLVPPLDVFSYGRSFLLDDAKLRSNLSNLQDILITLSSVQETITVTFLHASFADFLLDRKRSGIFYIGLGEAHANVANYLLDRHIINPGTPLSYNILYLLMIFLQLTEV